MQPPKEFPRSEALPASPFQSATGGISDLQHLFQQRPTAGQAMGSCAAAAVFEQRVRSSPVCIPGKGIPRQGSSSQPQRHSSFSRGRGDRTGLGDEAIYGRGGGVGGEGAYISGTGFGESSNASLVRRR